nr:hypothetical protein [Anaerolineae bacterium]
MSGVFDQLHNQIGGQDEDSGGISPLDLRDLPDNQRRIMRMMITEVELPYTEIREWAEDFMSQDDLDEALADLVMQGWLIRMGETNIVYEANLRRKAGSELAKSVWANLDKKIAEAQKARDEAMEDINNQAS